MIDCIFDIRTYSTIRSTGKKSSDSASFVNIQLREVKIFGPELHFSVSKYGPSKFEIAQNLSRDGICMWFWDSSKFEPFSFLFISARKIDHVSKFWDGSLFNLVVRKFWDSSEFEEKLNSRQNDSNFALRKSSDRQQNVPESGILMFF